MKESRVYLILAIIVILNALYFSCKGQSFYSSRYDKGRTTQLNKKTVAQKKQLNFIQKHSLLYKIRRDASHDRKRKNFKKGKTL